MTEAGWTWSAAELKAATEFTEDSIAIFSPEGRHLFVNRMAADAFGLKPEDLVGRTQAELGFDPGFRAVWEALLREAAERGEPQIQEYEARMPGGTRWLRTHMAPVRGPDGRLRALVASTKDLTEQRRSEALRENQLEIMRRIEAGDSLAELMQAITGLAQGRVPGRAVALLLRQGTHYAGSDSLSAELLGAIAPAIWSDHPGAASEAAPEPRSVKWINVAREPAWEPVRRQLLQLGWQSAWTHPIRGRDGRPLGAVLMLHRRARAAKSWEIAVLAESAASAELALEHRLTQDSLLESQARYRAIVDQSLALICVTDVHGRVLELNLAAQTLLGYAPADEIGQSVFRHIHPEDRKRMLEVFRPLTAADDQTASAVYRCRHADGSWRVLEAVAKSLRNVRGRRVIILNSRDITPRMRAAEALRASNARLQRALEATGLGLWEWDVQSGEIQSDERYRRILGYGPEGAVPMTAAGRAASVHPDDQAATSAAVLAHLRGETPYFEVRHRAKAANGEWKWLLARGQVVSRDAKGAPLRVTGTVRDIDAEHRMQENLDRITRRLQLLIEASDDGIMGLDREGRVSFANQAAAALLGYGIELMLGRPLAELIQHEFEDGIEQRWELTPVHRCLTENSRQRNVLEMFWRSAWRRFPVEYTISPLAAQGPDGGAVLIFRDASEKRALAKQLEHQALHDALTGLVNRRGFETQLQELIDSARREGRTHALCFMDLDQFKLINDTCGHAAGDELLRQLPRQLQAVVRAGDVLARLGGDEFAVLLPDTTLEQAAELAGKLRDTVRGFRFSWGGKGFTVGSSIGVVPITAETPSTTALLSAADAASYVAKDQGPNQVHVSQPGDEAVQLRRGEVTWVSRLRTALEEDHFRLYFQSLGALAHEPPQLKHHEVLLRLRADNGELVSPGQFMAVAERYQLMRAIDEWVIDRTLKTLGRQLITHPALRRHCLGINLSGESIRRTDLAHSIREKLERYRVPAEMLYFEITENAAISDFQVASGLMAELRAIGCRLALDDFGSGMSSFSYLKNLPVDFLKIDGSFIRDFEKSSVDQSIVRAIHSVGRNMGIETVAEYVETPAVLRHLREIGIDYAQGYAVARPLPLEDLPDLVAAPAVA